MENSNADVVVEIPPHFERSLVRGENPQILVTANAVNGIKDSMGTQYASRVVTQHLAPARLMDTLDKKVSVLYLYNKHLNYKLFMIPSLMAILMMLSGLFTPVRSMPHWAYLTTYVNPKYYFIDAIRTVFVRGGGFASVTHQVLALAIIAAVMNTWAVVSYRKKLLTHSAGFHKIGGKAEEDSLHFSNKNNQACFVLSLICTTFAEEKLHSAILKVNFHCARLRFLYIGIKKTIGK